MRHGEGRLVLDLRASAKTSDADLEATARPLSGSPVLKQCRSSLEPDGSVTVWQGFFNLPIPDWVSLESVLNEDSNGTPASWLDEIPAIQSAFRTKLVGDRFIRESMMLEKERPAPLNTEFLRIVPPDRLAPGDGWVVNHPEVGGNHLPDVKLIRPVFHGDRLIAFAVSLAHWADIGGAWPGSYYAEAFDAIQEGFHAAHVDGDVLHAHVVLDVA